MAKGYRIRWDEPATAGENARLKLPALVERYFDDGRALAAGAASPDELHRFRLKTKRVRYTLEFFRAWYGPGLAGRLASIRKIQNFLGEISDCATALDAAQRTMPADSPDRNQVESYLDERSRQQTAAFRRYWRQVFDKPGEQRRWRNYLARAAGKPGTVHSNPNV
jgi:CHAD domain-containing protein